MGETGGFHHHLPCPPRFIVEQRDGTHTGGSQNNRLLPRVGEDSPRAGPGEEKLCGDRDREGMGEAEAEGGSMLGPPGCGLEMSTCVQRASPVRMGGLYFVKRYPCFSLQRFSSTLHLEAMMVESFLPTPFSEAFLPGQLLFILHESGVSSSGKSFSLLTASQASAPLRAFIAPFLLPPISP